MIDPGVEMLLFPPRSATTAALLAALLLSVIGGVVGAPPPPILDEELLLLAASTLEAAHMSNMVEVDGESLKFDVELLSLETAAVTAELVRWGSLLLSWWLGRR